MSMMEGVYPMNKNLRRLAEPGATIHMFVLVAFAVATLLFGLYELAAIEAGVILLLVIISIFAKQCYLISCLYICNICYICHKLIHTDSTKNLGSLSMN